MQIRHIHQHLQCILKPETNVLLSRAWFEFSRHYLLQVEADLEKAVDKSAAT